MDFLQKKIEILVLFGSAARAVVARSGPNLVVTLGKDPSTIPQSLVAVAQTITCGARILLVYKNLINAINVSTTV